FFANPPPAVGLVIPSSPTYGQGQTFLGHATVATDAQGNASTTVLVPFNVLGQLVSATATDSDGNTSEFSLDVPVGSLVPTLTDLAEAPTREGFGSLTLAGTGFVPDSPVLLNGTPLATTFITNTTLTAVIPTGLTEEGVAEAVTVVNPGPGGGTSNAVTFT